MKITELNKDQLKWLEGIDDENYREDILKALSRKPVRKLLKSGLSLEVSYVFDVLFGLKVKLLSPKGDVLYKKTCYYAGGSEEDTLYGNEQPLWLIKQAISWICADIEKNPVQMFMEIIDGSETEFIMTKDKLR